MRGGRGDKLRRVTEAADALQNMTGDGVRRVATATGALLIAADDAAAFGSDPEALFTPGYWQAHGRLEPTARGRGSSWFITTPGGDRWALRHYRRGGWLATQVALDRYLWRGEPAVRAFVEWRLLADLRARGLPVPVPLGARYLRSGLTYACDLITRRIPDAAPLSDLLEARPAGSALWLALGATVARLHAAGCDHADLNAHNLLVAGDGSLSVIDFDRGRLRAPGAWRDANLGRLRRSLLKVTAGLPADRFTATDWSAVLDGYAAAGGSAGARG
jgi:3-deoxy-D-manno-octulosonic acid kinase